MLKKILKGSDCAECRVCCVFDKSDMWEIPLIGAELYDYIRKNFPEQKLQKRMNSHVFDMEFEANGLSYCPMLGEKGCLLGDNKPFDCKIWPLRVMSVGENRVITASPVCETVSKLPIAAMSEFVAENADTIFKAAENQPDIVKPYIDGYPIFAVKTEG